VRVLAALTSLQLLQRTETACLADGL
jgi:hypothetical protein